MNGSSTNTRLHRHRAALRTLIEAYGAATDEHARARLLMQIRDGQQQFAWFRHSAEDYADPLSWVDSWRPPMD